MDTIRKIIHVDMDAYYASVEILDNPSLKDLPVIVGGSPESRGVVCTCNYTARKYGVRSAMACSVAKRLCPEGVFVVPRFSRYKEISQKIREIFYRYSSLVEPLSLDEAYIDVTDNPHGLYASVIAKKIREDVFKETGLTCSAGVGPNKLVAKIASEFNKPNGLTVVTPDQVLKFMEHLHVRKIHGVGPATEKKLLELGIKTCSDIRLFDADLLEKKMGSSGSWLKQASLGIDFRSVETNWERKSYGKEETLDKDVLDSELVKKELWMITKELAKELEAKTLFPKTLTLKIKYHDFESITRSRTLEKHLNSFELLYPILEELMDQKTLVGKKAVRLVGCSTSNFM